jgi:hypothetical protein
MGHDPTTSDLEGRRSAYLSYIRITLKTLVEPAERVSLGSDIPKVMPPITHLCGPKNWSRRWGSNPRQSRWQRGTLPLSYACMEDRVGLEPTTSGVRIPRSAY